MSRGIVRNIISLASKCDEIVERLNKIDSELKRFQKADEKMRKIAMSLGILGVAGDCLYALFHQTSKPSDLPWSSLIGICSGLTLYVTSKNVVRIKSTARSRELNNSILSFDSDFQGFKVIAMFIMEDYLRDAPESHRQIFRDYILNIHNSFESLSKIPERDVSCDDPTYQEALENFKIISDNARQMAQSYESINPRLNS
jgi:hypothetical protein